MAPNLSKTKKNQMIENSTIKEIKKFKKVSKVY